VRLRIRVLSPSLFAAVAVCAVAGASADDAPAGFVPPSELLSPLPDPVVDETSWVLIEVWPAVRDVTLAAYFLDFSFEKNENLCAATKRALERDPQKGETSYRLCMPVSEARQRGYFRSSRAW
jgi:hypothetical protein